jgi:hypothetical protein
MAAMAGGALCARRGENGSGEANEEAPGIPIARTGVGSSGRGRGARGGGGSARRPCTVTTSALHRARGGRRCGRGGEPIWATSRPNQTLGQK